MIKYIPILALLFFALACKEQKISAPSDRETMVMVLRDMMIIESQVSMQKEEVRDSVKMELQSALKAEYNWTESDLDQFAAYLSQHPEESLELHDEVRLEVKELEKEL